MNGIGAASPLTARLGAVLDTPDRIRPPSPLDLQADAYKEWLHVNLFDLAAGSMVLVNVSLHGAPGDRRSLAAATVVAAELDGAFTPRLEVVPMAAAAVGQHRLAVEGVAALALDPWDRRLHVSAVRDGRVLEVSCLPAAAEIRAEAPIPYGSGWIAWRATPRMTVVPYGAETANGLIAYHDHNWGRWYWGDDAAWEWGTFASDDGLSLVSARTTDRAHRTGSTRLWYDDGRVRRRFGGAQVTFHGRLRPPPRRVPGAMAALHTDRANPRLPSRIGLVADDGYDRCQVVMDVQHACQLITADPVVPGWAFIHELFGRFTYRATIGGHEAAGEGLGVFEHVT